MGDMTRRPRGGWQVGTSLQRTQRAIAEHAGGEAAQDCYTVARNATGFIVRHFPSADATTPCCVVHATPRPGEAAGDTLARAARHCEHKHEASR